METIDIYKPTKADLDRLYGPFKTNLMEKYGLTIQDLDERGYFFAGGTMALDRLRWNRIMNNKDYPDEQSKCICGVNIKYNAWVVDSNLDNLMVIGYDCKQHFIPEIKMKCSRKDCNELTLNSNLCNKCIKLYCSYCFEKNRVQSRYKIDFCKQCQKVMNEEKIVKCKGEKYTMITDHMKKKYVLDEKGNKVGTWGERDSNGNINNGIFFWNKWARCPGKNCKNMRLIKNAYCNKCKNTRL